MPDFILTKWYVNATLAGHVRMNLGTNFILTT